MFRLPKDIARRISPVSERELWGFLEISSAKMPSSEAAEERVLATLSALLSRQNIKQ